MYHEDEYFPDQPTHADRLDMLRARNKRLAAERADPDPPLLRSHDFRDGFLKGRAEAGTLVRLCDGTFVEPPPREWKAWRKENYLIRATARAVGLSLPESLVIGGQHAAILHGIPVLNRRRPVEVHGPSHGSTIRRRVGHRRVVRAHALDDAILVDGIRVTSPIRTAVDCARHLEIDEALVIVNGFLNELAQPVPWRRPEGEAAIAAVKRQMLNLLDAEPRFPGNRRARLVLSIADGWAESPLESQTLRVIHLLGLPRPVLQEQLVTSRFEHYFDASLTWPMPDGSTWRARIQSDGRTKYEEPSVMEREREREADVRKQGDHQVNLRWDHLNQPGLRDATELIASVVPPHVRSRIHVVARFRTTVERERALFVERFPEIIQF